MKKFISLVLVLTMIIVNSITIVFAESNYLFDADYYAIKYPDLMRAFGTNKAALYNHWNNYGKREGRSPSPIYDPDYYLNNNEDLRRAFGTNYTQLYNHFISYGINEFRKSSPIYDGTYYKSHYGDLQNAFGDNSSSYLSHFVSYGMHEGRQASDNFNVHDYKSRYVDLQQAFSNNLKSYYYHYMEYGISEGRDGKPTGSNSPKLAVQQIAQQHILGLLVANVDKVPKLKQPTGVSCKSTAMAQSLNIIVGSNKYNTADMGGNYAISIEGNTYRGTDGKTYRAIYKTDGIRGSKPEQQSKIDAAVANGLPIVVAVHKKREGTKHHWVTIIGKSGDTYEIIDPWSGTRATMSEAGYDFGLADYRDGIHYGYVCFT